jgi:hypothetical protein
MDKTTALALLEEELDRLRAESYAQVAARIGQGPLVISRPGPDGEFQIEIEFLWDHQPGGNLRVVGAVDDGGWQAFLPLTRDFILRPDGTFLDEG